VLSGDAAQGGQHARRRERRRLPQHHRAPGSQVCSVEANVRIHRVAEWGERFLPQGSGFGSRAGVQEYVKMRRVWRRHLAPAQRRSDVP
jgi:hypothetical protein